MEEVEDTTAAAAAKRVVVVRRSTLWPPSPSLPRALRH